MTRINSIYLGAIAAAMLIGTVSTKCADGTNSSRTILVDDDKVQCPTASFSTIQAAIDAARPGETIRVCRGTYPEQLVVDKSVTLVADNGVVLRPNGMTSNTSGLTQGDPIAAAVFVKNAPSVTIEGFRIDGSTNGLIECGPRLIGILFQDASGQIEHNAVIHFRLSPSLPGCQSGNAIEVETSPGASSNVTVVDNTVSDYQKNGITANEVGTYVTIDSNSAAGIGPTTGAAQNGIQIGFGASGIIENNSVVDHVWSPCVSPDQCETSASGILVFESNGVRVTGNSVGTSQVGISVGANLSRIDLNIVFNSPVLDGVAIVGNNNLVESNLVKQSDEAGVFIQGNNNRVLSNEILSATDGILVAPGSNGNTHSGNHFFATLKKHSQEPTPAANLATLNSDSVAPGDEPTAIGALPSGYRASPSR